MKFVLFVSFLITFFSFVFLLVLLSPFLLNSVYGLGGGGGKGRDEWEKEGGKNIKAITAEINLYL